MNYIYIFLPIVAWGVAGTIKFFLNYVRFGNEAIARIGNGGFPSTHTTVVSSAVMLIGFKNGFDNPVFSLGMAMLIITVIDALGLRRTLGKHAQVLNRIAPTETKLRESQGHNFYEVLGGLLLGTIMGYIVSMMR